MNEWLIELQKKLLEEYEASKKDVKDTMEDKIEANGYRRGLMYAIAMLEDEQ